MLKLSKKVALFIVAFLVIGVGVGTYFGLEYGNKENAKDFYSSQTKLSNSEIRENGYFLSPLFMINGSKTIQGIQLFDVEIADIAATEDGLSVLIDIKHKNQENIVTLEIDHFYLFTIFERETKEEKVDETNYQNFQFREKSYSGLFLFIPKEYNINERDIEKYCKNAENVVTSAQEILCTTDISDIANFEIESSYFNTEKTLETSDFSQRLILTGFISNE